MERTEGTEGTEQSSTRRRGDTEIYSNGWYAIGRAERAGGRTGDREFEHRGECDRCSNSRSPVLLPAWLRQAADRRIANSPVTFLPTSFLLRVSVSPFLKLVPCPPSPPCPTLDDRSGRWRVAEPAASCVRAFVVSTSARARTHHPRLHIVPREASRRQSARGAPIRRPTPTTRSAPCSPVAASSTRFRRRLAFPASTVSFCE